MSISLRQVDLSLRSFAEMYNALKAPRKLVWKKQVGLARLKLDFDAGIGKVFDVSLILQQLSCISTTVI